MREAHSDQNVVSNVPPTVVASDSAGNVADTPQVSDNVEEEQDKGDVNRTDLVMDDCSNGATAAASPLPATEAVNIDGLNDSGQV